MLILSQHGSSGLFSWPLNTFVPPPYCIAAATQLCTCIGHNSQYTERGKGSMKESWPKWERSIPGHSPEIRVDLWNSSTWGNETLGHGQDLGESFKSQRGMNRSLCLLLSLSMTATLSPWFFPCLCCSSQGRDGTNPLFLPKSLARRWCEDVLAHSCGDNYEHCPCSRRYERIYGLQMQDNLCVIVKQQNANGLWPVQDLILWACCVHIDLCSGAVS